MESVEVVAAVLQGKQHPRQRSFSLPAAPARLPNLCSTSVCSRPCFSWGAEPHRNFCAAPTHAGYTGVYLHQKPSFSSG